MSNGVSISVFFLIFGRDEDGELVELGDLTLIDDGSAVVNNDYDGIGLRFFDSHAEAVHYVETRVCATPIYYDPDKQMTAKIRVEV